jgi:hypothetical protein
MPHAVAEPRIVVGEDFQQRLGGGEERAWQQWELGGDQFPDCEGDREQDPPRAGAADAFWRRDPKHARGNDEHSEDAANRRHGVRE